MGVPAGCQEVVSCDASGTNLVSPDRRHSVEKMRAKTAIEIISTSPEPMTQVACRSVCTQIGQETNQFYPQVSFTMQKEMDPGPRLTVVPAFQWLPR